MEDEEDERVFASVNVFLQFFTKDEAYKAQLNETREEPDHGIFFFYLTYRISMRMRRN